MPTITIRASASGGAARLARAVLSDDIALAARCGFSLAQLVIHIHLDGRFSLDISPAALED